MKILESATRVMTHVSRAGDAGMSDAELLEATAKRNTDVFVTCDQNLVEQQSVAGRPFGIVVICTNNWPTILKYREAIIAAIEAVAPGTAVETLKSAHFTRYGRSTKLIEPDA